MKAIILAGGKGTRLSPFTDVIPKPLLPINGQALIEFQIRQLANAGFEQITICTHHMADYIANFLGGGERYGIKLQYSKEKTALGTAGPLKLCRDFISTPVLVLNADILCGLRFDKIFKRAIEDKCDLGVVYKTHVSCSQFGHLDLNGKLVLGVEEKPEVVQNVMAGIYVVSPVVVDLIPDSESFGMDALVMKGIANGKNVLGYQTEDHWLDVGRATDLDKAVEVARKLLEE